MPVFRVQPIHLVCEYKTEEAQNMLVKLIERKAKVDVVMDIETFYDRIITKLYHTPLATAIYHEYVFSSLFFPSFHQKKKKKNKGRKEHSYRLIAWYQGNKKENELRKTM